MQLQRSSVGHTTRPSLATARQILSLLFGPPGQRAFHVRYWEGTLEGPAHPTPATLVFNSPASLRRMLLPPSDLALGEAYIFGDFDVEGNLEFVLAQAVSLGDRLLKPLVAARVLALLLALPGEARPTARPAFGDDSKAHTKERDAHAIRYHYDIGNDFYKLWLDERMVYSCAYFNTGQESLEEAQATKLDRICRKLRLQPGERMLDIGCGWGGLAIYAAQHYGVTVTGITLSPSQAEIARERAEAAGVDDRVIIEIRDYRDLPATIRYDKVASVGMFEHVGRAKMPQYFAQIYRLLKPGGLLLNHGIVKEIAPAFIHWGFGTVERYLNSRSFLQNYVFPDGELRRLSEVNLRAEQAGFEIRDAENMREHYALTLREWVRRLESHHAEVLARGLADEVTYRIWRLYMSGSAQSFAAARIGIVQTLMVKPFPGGEAGLPLNRTDIEGMPLEPAPQV
ncbi:class I SAM-dependent methyltransferase [Deinococcus rubellus]|uniref:Cyclopropane-fatty-acyl-phospholipid synthase family protein n=1 Tax=Deinococcus rubellus TaxID=1889240 RepID=A0ABY5YIE5_9DEIO|nr:cyclopropane-fatty-acyl-phospholipid synthase family protein [Deinococcus rubellus]UWX64706.1 cyclopropane-fatty-acyl-phospholipid synthase family protein [Deinococcus rubellus]